MPRTAISPRTSRHPPPEFRVLKATSPLRRLPPLSPNPQKTTNRPRQPYKPIIQINPLQRTRRDRDIAQIADELHLHNICLFGDFLLLDDALAVLFADALRALSEPVEGV
jgi:hypothetical protein